MRIKFNLRFFRNVLLFFCVSLFLTSAIRVITPDIMNTSLESLIKTYNIGEKLNEEEALKILSVGNVDSVISQDNLYILKTSENMYYQTDNTKSVTMGLELAGLKNTIMSQTAPLSFLDSILNLFFIMSFLFILFSAIWYFVKKRAIAKFSEFSFLPMGANANMDEYERDFKENAKEKSETVELKKVTFEDIQGLDEIKPDLYRLVDCLKNPEKYANMGARMSKGVVFYGPPGTGKTLTAKALSGEADVPFLSMCGSDFVEKYVGVGASRIRDLYKQARKVAPCIVFIDEIDAIGGGRGDGNNGEKDQTINALLAELDGFKSADNILTICATNRLDILDPALLRAGRFDLKLAIGLPDLAGREAILKVHSKNKKFDETISLHDIAKSTMGFSGAELENLLNESALIAANTDKIAIDKTDIENAFYKIVMGGNKRKRKDKDADKILTAYHEAGHALISKLLVNEGVSYVTITPSTSGAGGVTFLTPDEDTMPSKKYLRNKIKMSYGGRAAEELYLGNVDDITTGASEDIRQATSIIKKYISNYGMGEYGPIDIKQLTYQYDIVEEASKLANSLYAETLTFLGENRDKLDLIADTLIEKETVYESELDTLLGLVVVKVGE